LSIATTRPIGGGAARLAALAAAALVTILAVTSWSTAEARAELTPPPGKPPAGWVSDLRGTPAPPGVDYSAYGDAGLRLVPPPRTPGQAQPNVVVSTRLCSISEGTLPQSQRFATIRNIPGGLVVGNCRGGSIAYQHGQDANGTWGFDYVSSFNNCGWLLYSNTPLQNNNSNNHCLNSPTNPALSSFAFYSNCAPQTCSDGSPIYLQSNCQAYANVNPEVPHSGGVDPTWVFAAGEMLLWRYVTADNNYIMVRHPGISTGDGNWVFLPSGCFDPSQLTTLNPYTVSWYRGSAA
jgi:hypothetical protein